MITRRVFVGLSAAFAVVVAATTPALAETTFERIKATGKMVVGTEAAYPPFEFIQDGQIVGFGRDLLDEIAKAWGVEVEQLDLPFQGILPGLLAGKFDFVATSNARHATPTRWPSPTAPPMRSRRRAMPTSRRSTIWPARSWPRSSPRRSIRWPRRWTSS